MKRVTTALVILLALFCIEATGGNHSVVELKDGSRITIDTTTRRATQDGEPLWDGTHRRKDGSVVIIRDGVVIDGFEAPENSPQAQIHQSPALTLEVSPCVQLSINSCGFNGACRESEPCKMAKQLLNFELQEKMQGVTGADKSATAQCAQSLENDLLFPPCTAKPDTQTPCTQLIAHVCGFRDQCANSDACVLARQLLTMEQEELMLTPPSTRLTTGSTQCLEAIKTGGVFSQCTTYE